MSTCINATIIATAIASAQNGQVLAWEDGQYIWVDPPQHSTEAELIEYNHAVFFLRDSSGEHTQEINLFEHKPQGTSECCVRPYLQTEGYFCVPPMDVEEPVGRMYFRKMGELFLWANVPPRVQLSTPEITFTTDDEARIVTLTLNYPSDATPVMQLEYSVYLNDVLHESGTINPNMGNPSDISLSTVYPDDYAQSNTVRVTAIAQPVQIVTHIPSEEAEEEVTATSPDPLRIVSITPFHREEFKFRNRSIRVEFAGQPDPNNLPKKLVFDWRIRASDAPLRFPQTIVDGSPVPSATSDEDRLSKVELGYILNFNIASSGIEIDYTQPLILTWGTQNEQFYSSDPDVRRVYELNHFGAEQNGVVGYQIVAGSDRPYIWDWGTAFDHDEYWALYGVIAYSTSFNPTIALDVMHYMSNPDASGYSYQYLEDLLPPENFYQATYPAINDAQFKSERLNNISVTMAMDLDNNGILVLCRTEDYAHHPDTYVFEYYNRITGAALGAPITVSTLTTGVVHTVPLPMTLKEMSNAYASQAYNVRVSAVDTDPLATPYKYYGFNYWNTNSFVVNPGTAPQTHNVLARPLTPAGNVQFELVGWLPPPSFRVTRATCRNIMRNTSVARNVQQVEALNTTYEAVVASELVRGEDYIIVFDRSHTVTGGQQAIVTSYLFPAVDGTDIPDPT